MPNYERDGATIYYEVSGKGPPLLLIAPGGMRSAISFWEQTPWNPIAQLSGRYQVIAMDQRNAGHSTAPVSAADGWHTYTADQLGLMDHLGITQFHVAGMCIGGPYSFGLIDAAPDRVLSATLFQTIGRDDNKQAFYDMFDSWAAPLKETHPEANAEDWSTFRENMYGGDTVLFNVDDAFLRGCQTPLLVLLGNDLYHPKSSSRLVANLAPNATLIEDWKDGDAKDAAMKAFEGFLETHTV